MALVVDFYPGPYATLLAEPRWKSRLFGVEGSESTHQSLAGEPNSYCYQINVALYLQ
jgi:hypothetical protein